MNDDCRRVEALADDLALGLLTGADRAAALAHLDECHACRAEVASLTETADAVLLLAPAVSPDAGFDRRVLARIDGARGRPEEHLVGAWAVNDVTAVTPLVRRGRVRRVLSIAAVLLGIVAASILWQGHRPADTALTADMVDGRGEVVGEVSLVADHGTVVAMDLQGWNTLERRYGESPQYRLGLVLDDGSRSWVVVDAAGNGSWELRTGVDRSDIASVTIADREGRIWCQARFA